MAFSNTPRPAYVFDTATNEWIPVGVGGHSHPDYITQATAVNPTLIDAKGDIITATAADTPARLAVGNNGETLVADSSTSTGLRYQGSMAAGRNVIINGGMDIWQRGTSFTSSGVYAADRFIVGRSGGVGGGTYTRQVTGDTTNLPNIQYCIRLQRDSGNTSTANMGTGTVVETANAIPFAGKTVTMSFYARVGANFSATSSTINAYLTTGTGTDQNGILGAWTGTATPLSQNFTATTTWQRFSVTGTLASNATEFYNYINFTPTGTAGAADYLEVTGIQLEIGSVATPFTRTGGSIQGELAACQRYYFRISSSVAADMVQGQGYGTTGVGYVHWPKVTMRVAPTAIEYATIMSNYIGVAAFNITAITLNSTGSNTNALSFNATHASGITQGVIYTMSAQASGGYFGYTAEL